MDKRKYKFDVIAEFSLMFYMSLLLIRPYITRLFSAFSFNTSVIFIFFANVLLAINIVIVKNINKIKIKYFVFLSCLLIPLFYKNAFLEDHMYSVFLVYLMTITYVFLLNALDINVYMIKLFKYSTLTFAIMTAIVTWYSLISPNGYARIFIKLLPISEQFHVNEMFFSYNMRMGLTDHYSRNAFYIVLGIIITSVDWFYEKTTKNMLVFLFLMSTLLMIGKRGHFIFVLFSIVICYFIKNKVKWKTILKFFVGVITITLLFLMLAKYIPSIENMVMRFKSSDGDISTGRFYLYDLALKAFKRNGYKGIGWGQFTKSTDYYFAGVHNDYIQILCETGILGFFMMIGANIYMMFKTYKKFDLTDSPLILIALSYQIFFMSYSLTGIPHYDTEVYMTYFILVAIVNNSNINNIIKQV